MECFYCGTEPNNATTKKGLYVCCCYMLKSLNGKITQHYSNDKDEIEDLKNQINRQKADIKKLTSGKCVYLSDDETTEYCVEGPCPNYKTEAQIKSEAYKEFADKANEIIDLIIDLLFDDSVSKCQLPSCHKPSSIPCENEICIQDNKEYWHSKLNDLLKELVGDK